MRVTVRGVRSVEIEMSDPDRAAEFYVKVWHLNEIDSVDGVRYLRGTGAYHHILAIRRANRAPSLRRIVFDVADRDIVDQLHRAVSATSSACETPHEIDAPGGGYGFGFIDPEGRNLAVICGVADHHDNRDIADRPRKIAHVNVNSADLTGTTRFLVETLGFRLVDETVALSFFHADNADHNSFVVCRHGRATLNHVAFEMPDLDSVMRGAGRMRDHGFPIEWGVGRHGAGNNVFAYFAGPEEFPIELTGEILQIDDTYVPHGSDYWRWPPGRLDQWGVTNPHTTRWKRVQDLHGFTPGAFRL
jgi:catechol 2,3-dioxygenase-like lactoylglutathione lyase family enzyme/predicted enzyme related to lactoylglutathione lyase